ncbi:hypothetical protein LHJ74_10860 [Streptomyces sp. N2-109]|uniref:Secreted protein n=1 Tax=Streptomyces gossypii TaxID=2883101 RepID=A0ABT2JR90_9ACTN|nr:hypothetical protein [Streptomyces gossypii]MCT2590406.1 hypothetical protein [Streptomyces gossypii]
MEFVIGVLALLVVVCVTLGVVAAVKTVRAVKRGVERTGAQVRRTVEETTLKARTAQPGAVGEVARVRMELRSSIDSTRRALEAGADGDPSLREALGLLDRLHDHARQLDGELRLLMEREPDRVRIAERLPEVRKRVSTIRESADSLRFAAQDRAHQFDAEGLTSLREQIEIESGALRGWQEPSGGVPLGAAPERGRAAPIEPPGERDQVSLAKPEASEAPGELAAPVKPEAPES